jgi:hypothetical protein
MRASRRKKPEMLGVNLLVRLGRSVLAGPVADAGLLPAGYYRHLVLAAIEAEDFPAALRHLKWTDDPLLVQILIFRVRLLAEQHRRRRQALLDLTGEAIAAQGTGAKPDLIDKCQALLQQEEQAVRLLEEYEAEALKIMPRKAHAV